MTNQLPDDISFERWVQHVFDHPVPEGVSAEVRQQYIDQMMAFSNRRTPGEPMPDALLTIPAWFSWYHQLNRESWRARANPNRTVAYITQLFSSIDRLIEAYSVAQIAQGLNFLIDPVSSEHMIALFEGGVPLNEQIACIDSFYVVYRDLFAIACSPILSHALATYDADYNRLNNTCYMWWDMMTFPLHGHDPAREKLNQPILDVMDKTLQIDHIACQEGALHGLGHWFRDYPTFVQKRVNRFLAKNPRLPRGLHKYALAARTGRVQ
jgi:hypothetical protein